MVPLRLLALCLLGVATMFATGCAGKTVTAQPQGLNDASPVEGQTPEPAPRCRQTLNRTNRLILLPGPKRVPVRSMIPGNR